MIINTVGPVILIGLVITVAIYAGIATPTEAAAVASLLTVVLAFGVGGLTWQGFKDAIVCHDAHHGISGTAPVCRRSVRLCADLLPRTSSNSPTCSFRLI